MSNEIRVFLFELFDAAEKKYREWVDAGGCYLMDEDPLMAEFAQLAEQGRENRHLSGDPFPLFFKFAREFAALQTTIANSDDGKGFPADSFWMAWDAITMSRVSSLRNMATPLEPLKQLLSLSGMTVGQVARMYGWLLPGDKPDTARVIRQSMLPEDQQERPINPHQARFDQQHSERVQKVSQYRSARTRRREVETAPCAETVEELLLQEGITADQIAEMRKCTVQEVFKEARRLGLPAPKRRKNAPVYYGDESDTDDHIPEEGDEGPTITGAAPSVVRKAIAAQDDEEGGQDAADGQGDGMPTPKNPIPDLSSRRGKPKRQPKADAAPRRPLPEGGQAARQDDAAPASVADEEYTANVRELRSYLASGMTTEEAQMAMGDRFTPDTFGPALAAAQQPETDENG